MEAVPKTLTCRRCGVEAATPERHYAMGRVECPGGDQEFIRTDLLPSSTWRMPPKKPRGEGRP